MIKKLNLNISLIRPKGILFDTDNTLYEYEPAKKMAELAVFNKVNKLLGINRKMFYYYFDNARAEIKNQLVNTASSHSRLLYFQRMLENIGYKGKLMLALDLEQTFWRTFLANAPLFEGLLDFINLLKNESIPIGIVTDLTSNIQLRKLTYFNFENTFDAVVCSEEVGVDKPNSQNFLLAKSKLGLGNSDLVWMIGDNAYTDIYGGKKIGAITFQKIHKGVKIGEGSQQADFTFKNYDELSSYFLSI